MAELSILTIREVADLPKVNEKTVYRLARSKRLPGFKVAGSWRFKHSDIDVWIDQEKEAAGHPSENNKLGRREP